MSDERRQCDYCEKFYMNESFLKKHVNTQHKSEVVGGSSRIAGENIENIIQNIETHLGKFCILIGLNFKRSAFNSILLKVSCT